ncbi:sel1 repeat family protein [Oxalobacteraceae bacterium]|nr:sel1 repeat family protein [Oxalobacteraceae bacterium]
MSKSRRRRIYVLALILALAAGALFLNNYLQEKALHALPYGFKKFSLNDPLPACARWKENMPSTRDPATYRLYIAARKVWRSKIEWQLTRDEAVQILNDVRDAADQGDWGARALLAHFYLEGLGPLESNNVLKPDPYKSVEIAHMAAKAMQPWGLYDLGVAYEHGYGGAHYDVDLAWAYYLRAAQLGSPEAQMALAQAYGAAGRRDDEILMLLCAYQQGHGAAAYSLGVKAEVNERYKDAIDIYQAGVKFGNKECAAAMEFFFADGSGPNIDDDERKSLQQLGIKADLERKSRYNAIYDALQINPDLKLSRLDQVLPLPPAKLPEWSGVEDAVTPESTGSPTY